jgi:exodeoxyribonuclease-3
VRLLSWNVNGVRAALKKGFLDWLRKESPDVLCLQETKAEPSQLPAELAAPEGYKTAWDWPLEKKGYSGVATLSRVNPLSVDRGLGIAEFDREGRVLVSRYPEFALYNVYFPNGKRDQTRLDYKLRFYDAFLDLLKRDLRNNDGKIIICGDVNTAHRDIDLARPKENSKVSGFLPAERAWIDRLIEAGFIDTFRVFEADGGHYTWWDQMTRARERNVGWRIDYFFVSEKLRPHLKAAFHEPQVMGSDHCPVGIEMRFS